MVSGYQETFYLLCRCEAEAKGGNTFYPQSSDKIAGLFLSTPLEIVAFFLCKVTLVRLFPFFSNF